MPCLRLAVILWMGSLAGLALAETPLPTAILPDSLHWVRPPQHPTLQGAWVLGAKTKSGRYLLRVKLASGGKIPPYNPSRRA